MNTLLAELKQITTPEPWIEKGVQQSAWWLHDSRKVERRLLYERIEDQYHTLPYSLLPFRPMWQRVLRDMRDISWQSLAQSEQVLSPYWLGIGGCWTPEIRCLMGASCPPFSSEQLHQSARPVLDVEETPPPLSQRNCWWFWVEAFSASLFLTLQETAWNT